MYCNPASLILRNNHLANNHSQEEKQIPTEVSKTMTGGIIKGDKSLGETNKELQKVAKKLFHLKTHLKPKKIKPANITF